MTAHPALVAGAAAVLLAGCGLQDPYATTPRRPHDHPPTAAADHLPGSELPNAAAAQPGPPRAGRRGARAVLRAFAWRWVNWDWRHIAPQQRSLAVLAAGPLARQLQDGARGSQDQARLSGQRPASRGRVIAVALTGARRGIAVTYELTSTRGQPDPAGPRYRVHVAQLTHRRAGWKVTAWEPQP